MIEGFAVSAGCAGSRVLNLVYPSASFHVVVCRVEQVKDLGLKGDGPQFGNPESALESKVDFGDPRTGEGVQAISRCKSMAGKARGGIRRTLQSGGVSFGITDYVAPY